MSNKQNSQTAQAPKGFTDDVKQALREFAAQYGRYWKMELRLQWQSGRCSSPPLMQFRNNFGPSGLMKITKKMLDTTK